eukprot:gene15183-biopygen17164
MGFFFEFPGRVSPDLLGETGRDASGTRPFLQILSHGTRPGRVRSRFPLFCGFLQIPAVSSGISGGGEKPRFSMGSLLFKKKLRKRHLKNNTLFKNHIFQGVSSSNPWSSPSSRGIDKKTVPEQDITTIAVAVGGCGFRTAGELHRLGRVRLRLIVWMHPPPRFGCVPRWADGGSCRVRSGRLELLGVSGSWRRR